MSERRIGRRCFELEGLGLSYVLCYKLKLVQNLRKEDPFTATMVDETKANNWKTLGSPRALAGQSCKVCGKH